MKCVVCGAEKKSETGSRWMAAWRNLFFPWLPWHTLEEFYSDSAGKVLKESADYQASVAAYRTIRDLPDDWIPHGTTWHWFRIGWDAQPTAPDSPSIWKS